MRIGQTGGVLRLDKDLHGDPQAIKGMLAHLYGIHFNLLDDCKDEQASIGNMATWTDLALYQVALHAVANKYQMPDLAKQTQDQLRGRYATLMTESADNVFKVAEAVYLKYPSEATALRHDIVEQLTNQPSVVEDDEKNKVRCSKMPDLVCEMLKVVAQKDRENEWAVYRMGRSSR